MFTTLRPGAYSGATAARTPPLTNGPAARPAGRGDRGDVRTGAGAASALRALRLASCAQGLSLLVLLLVTAPLSLSLGATAPFLAAASVHAFWSLALLATALRAHAERALSAREALRVAGLALAPFGFIAAERTLRRRAALLASWPRYVGRSSCPTSTRVPTACPQW